MNIQNLLDFLKNNEGRLGIQSKLIDILEGNLINYVKQQMLNELSTTAYKRSVERASPINVYKKLIYQFPNDSHSTHLQNGLNLIVQ